MAEKPAGRQGIVGVAVVCNRSHPAGRGIGWYRAGAELGGTARGRNWVVPRGGGIGWYRAGAELGGTARGRNWVVPRGGGYPMDRVRRLRTIVGSGSAAVRCAPLLRVELLLDNELLSRIDDFYGAERAQAFCYGYRVAGNHHNDTATFVVRSR
jgi:hypothetical protein